MAGLDRRAATLLALAAPFAAGSIDTAPAKVRDTMTAMLKGFTRKAHDIAMSLND
jgi:hypothetical protein